MNVDAMNAIELDLRDFPADVQDLLRDRAIRDRKPIGQIIGEFATEISTSIVGAAAPAFPAAASSPSTKEGGDQ